MPGSCCCRSGRVGCTPFRGALSSRRDSQSRAFGPGESRTGGPRMHGTDPLAGRRHVAHSLVHGAGRDIRERASGQLHVKTYTFVREKEHHCRGRSFTNSWIFATSILSVFLNCFRRGTQVWRGMPGHVESHIHKPNDKRHEEENAEQFRQGGGGVMHPFSHPPHRYRYRSAWMLAYPPPPGWFVLLREPSFF
jgi:hypothetical protein